MAGRKKAGTNMKNKDSTFLIIGIFLAIVLLMVLDLYILFGDVSAQDVLYGVLAVCALDGLCFLAHRAFNRKK